MVRVCFASSTLPQSVADMPQTLVELLRALPSTLEPKPAKIYSCADLVNSESSKEVNTAIVEKLHQAIDHIKAKETAKNELLAWQMAKLIVTNHCMAEAYNDVRRTSDLSHEDADKAVKHVIDDVAMAAQSIRPAKTIDDRLDDDRVCTTWVLSGSFEVEVQTTYDVAVLLQSAIEVHNFPTTLHFADYLKSIKPPYITNTDVDTFNNAAYDAEYNVERPVIHGYEWVGNRFDGVCVDKRTRLDGTLVDPTRLRIPGTRIDRRTVIFKSRQRWMREYNELKKQNREMASALSKMRHASL